jgi:hypothetical protein
MRLHFYLLCALVMMLLAPSILLSAIYMAFIRPVFGGRQRLCHPNQFTSQHGRLASISRSLTESPFVFDVTGELTCNQHDDADEELIADRLVMLPIHECPSRHSEETLQAFISRKCLPRSTAQAAIDRWTVTVADQDPLHILYSYTPWISDTWLGYIGRHHTNPPFVHLRSVANDTPAYFEHIDSFIERAYRNVTPPRLDQLRSTRGNWEILHRFDVSPTRWINYIRYHNDWQNLVYTVVMNKPANETDCCICQESRNDGDPKIFANCAHCFHTQCIREWIDTSPQNGCPLCFSSNIIIP